MLETRSTTENRKEPKSGPPPTLPGRLRNQDYRPREYLSEAEVERLISAALKEGHRRRQNRGQGRHSGDHSLRNALITAMPSGQESYAGCAGTISTGPRKPCAAAD